MDAELIKERNLGKSFESVKLDKLKHLLVKDLFILAF